MKLITRFTIWYLAITTLVLLAGSVLVFISVQFENDEEEHRRLHGIIEDQISALKDTTNAVKPSSNVEVKKISSDWAERPFTIIDTMGWHSTFQGTERQLKASQSVKISGEHFLISAYAFAPEPEETIAGITRSLSVIFIILLILVAVTSMIVSRKILSPFHKSLAAIKTFDLKQKQHLALPSTRTNEFQLLNSFLARMTAKALDDYRTLKEFSENASHELQTPLAIIRGKMELLLQSEISDEQAKLISDASEAVDKLSRTNQALILLTKLENQEYPAKPLNLSQEILKCREMLRELMEMKSLKYSSEVEPDVHITIHPALADVLLMNLFSNAIRHNFEGGSIDVTLTSQKLTIRNTGLETKIPTDQLFVRFKKNSQSTDSAGLGLSIVKKICDINGFTVDYANSGDIHQLSIQFR